MPLLKPQPKSPVSADLEDFEIPSDLSEAIAAQETALYLLCNCSLSGNCFRFITAELVLHAGFKLLND